MLPECVRPHFLKRVCIYGPESTGKSTLARDLAKHFETQYVWEYARPLLDVKGGQCHEADIPRIVRGQIAAEEALARQANRVLFCDTDVLTTTIWSDVLFGSVPLWTQELADKRDYDLYLLRMSMFPGSTMLNDSSRLLKSGERSSIVANKSSNREIDVMSSCEVLGRNGSTQLAKRWRKSCMKVRSDLQSVWACQPQLAIGRDA